MAEHEDVSGAHADRAEHQAEGRARGHADQDDQRQGGDADAGGSESRSSRDIRNPNAETTRPLAITGIDVP